MSVTIRDVARAAGVSTATVSNVLNRTGKVGRGTSKVVLSTVKRMAYVPDVHARHLASRDRRTLGIIVDRKSTRLNSSHVAISYAVFCLKKKKKMRNSSALKRCTSKQKCT